MGVIGIWRIWHSTLTIDVLELIKYRRWLPITVCLFTFIPIKKITSIYHNINFIDNRKFT